MPILRHPSRSDIAAIPTPGEASGIMPVPRRASVQLAAAPDPGSDAPPALPSLVVPPPSSERRPPASGQPMSGQPMSGPRPRTTVKMAAVRADDAPPSGRMLDSVDFIDPARVALELAARPPLSRPKTPATAKTPAVAFSPVGTSNVVRKPDMPDPRRPGIFAFAGFGLPPESIRGAPAYALRVMMRKRVLRDGLAVARRHGSPDVELYEAALRTADPDAYAKGLLALVLGPILAVTLVLVVAEVLL